MKTKINIEQFDNGITLRCEDAEVTSDASAIVVLDRDVYEAIGKEIWHDVQRVMNAESENAVEVIIEYKPVKK